MLIKSSRVSDGTSEILDHHWLTHTYTIDQLWLTQPADFNFTKRSKFTIEGVDDAEEFQKLMASGIPVLGIDSYTNILCE